MSVVDTDKIDGIGISKDGQRLVLLMTDHLDWSHEYEHLIQLQKKLNAYIAFLENQQYEEIYPNRKFSSFCIEIHFMYEPTANCIKFIDVAKKQLADQNISIDVVVDKS
jgi:hypothetical protein